MVSHTWKNTVFPFLFYCINNQSEQIFPNFFLTLTAFKLCREILYIFFVLGPQLWFHSFSIVYCCWVDRDGLVLHKWNMNCVHACIHTHAYQWDHIVVPWYLSETKAKWEKVVNDIIVQFEFISEELNFCCLLFMIKAENLIIGSYLKYVLLYCRRCRGKFYKGRDAAR
jgi:hypothetical protein